MNRLTIHASSITAGQYHGAVLCRDLTLDVKGKRTSVRRGTPLDEVLLAIPEEAGDPQLHLLIPEHDDITQEDASERVARGIVGGGLESTEPHQGQVDLRAATSGMLRVRSNAVSGLNATQLVLIATGLDGRVVEPGETVAIVKASELLVPASQIESILANVDVRPVIDVVPFNRNRVALIAGDRIREANLTVSSKHLAAGLKQFGAELVDVRKIPDDPEGIAHAYRELIDAGIDLILVAGSIVLDPEDPFLTALEKIDAQLVRRGAPIDPGTMFWVAQKEDVPFFGLASCEMYGKLSIIDLFMPFALASQPIDNELISQLGYGGLLNDTHVARRPASWRE